MQPANPIDPVALVLPSHHGAETTSAAAPRRRVWARVVALGALFVLGALVALEVRTSWLQSRVAWRISQELRWSVEPGASPAIAFPTHGPFDTRLGYTRLARVGRRLHERGFEITAQARMSPALLALGEWGIAPPGREKAAAGLTILDRGGEVLFAARHPRFTWERFEQIPPLVVETLLFIENRELLRGASPYANPAIEWDRLLRALAWQALPTDGRTPGASTLATQLEKYRHSPGGRTASASEKLRQMIGATLRAYHDGPDTRAERRRIVLDYLNTVPLAARPGDGEVTGLGDGLLAWHGADPERVSHLLADPTADPAERGQAYAQVLSLVLSERRPSHYLLRDRRSLGALVRTYLPLLHSAGIIDDRLLEAALTWSIREELPAPSRPQAADSKSITALRAHLVELLGVRDAYALDRLDLRVESTLDARAQRDVEALLSELHDPRRVEELGLRGDRLLGKGDPSEVVYSVLVYERTPEGNALRVQADTLDQPFNVNEGMKLDLGSTAKLRTLAHYLQIVEDLHARWGRLSPADLRALRVHPRDAISAWTIATLSAQPGLPVEELLAASLERTFSASPHERFYTGGGLHSFANFDDADDSRRMSLREAFTRSVNLPFVRVMREIVQHVLHGPEGRGRALLEDPAGWNRRAYLRRFANEDSRARLARFRARHAARAPEERIEDILERIRPLPRRMAAFHSWLAPGAGAEELGRFLAERIPGHGLTASEVASLHARYGAEALSLVDRARVMRIDPLELWLVDFLRLRPDPSPHEEWASSADIREADWAWIFRTRNERARERRIADVLERDAFAEIHRRWQQLGYPFDGLVASLATAIGAAADRPAALAELVGIIFSGGVRIPAVRVASLDFASATPYETRFRRTSTQGVQVLSPAVAATLREALLDVVDRGTARRAKGLFGNADDAPVVGGKTGTGDSRIKRFARGGQLISSRVMSRSATFVFGIGTRHFGVITAYVAGSAASEYAFTSGLPVQILKFLEPSLERLVRREAPDAMQSLVPETTTRNHVPKPHGNG